MISWAVYKSNSKLLSEDNMYISEQDVCDDMNVDKIRILERLTAQRQLEQPWSIGI